MAGGSSPQELNLIPYLDVVTTLMITMMVIASYDTLALGEVPVDAPSFVSKPGNGPPSFEVNISAAGFVVSRGGAAVGLRAGPGGMPYAALTAEARSLYDADGASLLAKVSADPKVPYSTVVHTLDALREDASGKLYPKVALAVGLATPTP